MEPKRKRRKLEVLFLSRVLESLKKDLEDKVFDILEQKSIKIRKTEDIIAKFIQRCKEKDERIENLEIDIGKLKRSLTEIVIRYKQQLKENEMMILKNMCIVAEIVKPKECVEITKNCKESDEILENIEPEECYTSTIDDRSIEQNKTIHHLKNEVAKLDIEKLRLQENVDITIQKIAYNLETIKTLQFENEKHKLESKDADNIIWELKEALTKNASDTIYKKNQNILGKETLIQEYKTTLTENNIETESIKKKTDTLYFKTRKTDRPIKKSQTNNILQHKCGVCQKQFSSGSNLYLHKSIHLAEKPFKCDDCDKGFTQKGNLKGHLQKHHSKF